MIVVVVDVTERRALLDAEHDARVRADFLARAGAILDASLDYEETLGAVAQIAIPEVADWCAVSVLDDDGLLHEVAAAHVDDAQRELGRELSRRYPPDPDTARGTYGVARSGETAYVREVTDEMIVAGIPDPEHRELVRRLGLRSVIIAALKARGRTFGTLSLASAESGRLFERRRRPARRGARRARRHGDRQRPALHRAQPHRPHPAGQAAARAPAGHPGHADGRALSRRRRAQRGRRRLLRRLPALPGRVGAGRGRRVGQGRRGRRRHRAGALHAARRARSRTGPPSGALRRLNTAMLYDDTSQFATVVVAYLSAGADGGHRRPARRWPATRRPPSLRRDGSVEMAGRFGHDGRPAHRHRRARRRRCAWRPATCCCSTPTA